MYQTNLEISFSSTFISTDSRWNWEICICSIGKKITKQKLMLYRRQKKKNQNTIYIYIIRIWTRTWYKFRLHEFDGGVANNLSLHFSVCRQVYRSDTYIQSQLKLHPRMLDVQWKHIRMNLWKCYTLHTFVWKWKYSLNICVFFVLFLSVSSPLCYCGRCNVYTVLSDSARLFIIFHGPESTEYFVSLLLSFFWLILLLCILISFRFANKQKKKPHRNNCTMKIWNDRI